MEEKILNDEYTLYFATYADIDDWMRLVEVVADDFPGLDMEDYRKTLIKNVLRQSACKKGI